MVCRSRPDGSRLPISSEPKSWHRSKGKQPLPTSKCTGLQAKATTAYLRNRMKPVRRWAGGLHKTERRSRTGIFGECKQKRGNKMKNEKKKHAGQAGPFRLNAAARSIKT